MIETLDAVYNNLDKDGIPQPKSGGTKEGKGDSDPTEEDGTGG